MALHFSHSMAAPGKRQPSDSSSPTRSIGLTSSHVLDRLLSGSTDYAARLPWNWAASHPEAIASLPSLRPYASAEELNDWPV